MGPVCSSECYHVLEPMHAVVTNAALTLGHVATAAFVSHARALRAAAKITFVHATAPPRTIDGDAEPAALMAIINDPEWKAVDVVTKTLKHRRVVGDGGGGDDGDGDDVSGGDGPAPKRAPKQPESPTPFPNSAEIMRTILRLAGNPKSFHGSSKKGAHMVNFLNELSLTLEAEGKDRLPELDPDTAAAVQNVEKGVIWAWSAKTAAGGDERAPERRNTVAWDAMVPGPTFPSGFAKTQNVDLGGLRHLADATGGGANSVHRFIITGTLAAPKETRAEYIDPNELSSEDEEDTASEDPRDLVLSLDAALVATSALAATMPRSIFHLRLANEANWDDTGALDASVGVGRTEHFNLALSTPNLVSMWGPAPYLEAHKGYAEARYPVPSLEASANLLAHAALPRAEPSGIVALDLSVFGALTADAVLAVISALPRLRRLRVCDLIAKRVGGRAGMPLTVDRTSMTPGPVDDTADFVGAPAEDYARVSEALASLPTLEALHIPSNRWATTPSAIEALLQSKTLTALHYEVEDRAFVPSALASAQDGPAVPMNDKYTTIGNDPGGVLVGALARRAAPIRVLAAPLPREDSFDAAARLRRLREVTLPQHAGYNPHKVGVPFAAAGVAALVFGLPDLEILVLTGSFGWATADVPSFNTLEFGAITVDAGPRGILFRGVTPPTHPGMVASAFKGIPEATHVEFAPFKFNLRPPPRRVHRMYLRGHKMMTVII